MGESATWQPRVLMVVENFSVPSDPRVWGECVALRDAGFEINVICPQGVDAAPFEEYEGIPIFRYPARPSDGSLWGYGREYLGAMWHVVSLARRLARRRQFDVVHAANPPDLLLPALWPLKRHGTRFVFDHHDLSPELYATRFGARPAWRDKTEYLRSRGGMALLITRPDCIHEPAPLGAYAGFLHAFANDTAAWKALPREVSNWWMRRAASRVVLDRGCWRVDGDRDAAVVAHIEPPTSSRVSAYPVREKARV